MCVHKGCPPWVCRLPSGTGRALQRASDVGKFWHNKAWELMFVLVARNVGSRLRAANNNRLWSENRKCGINTFYCHLQRYSKFHFLCYIWSLLKFHSTFNTFNMLNTVRTFKELNVFAWRKMSYYWCIVLSKTFFRFSHMRKQTSPWPIFRLDEGCHTPEDRPFSFKGQKFLLQGHESEVEHETFVMSCSLLCLYLPPQLTDRCALYKRRWWDT